MPQMSPMNWLALFMLFNLCVYSLFCKLTFLNIIKVSGSTSLTVPSFSTLMI